MNKIVEKCNLDESSVAVRGILAGTADLIKR
jgi:hypothetical protein